MAKAMKFGYARVSTNDQDTAIQVAALEAAGCDRVFAENKSGTKREGRAELDKMLVNIREGDTIVVTRVDRLARSVLDLQNIVKELKDKGVALRATEQPIDTSTPAGKAFFDMLGVFAEFETSIRYERQMEGIKKAKAAGVYKGRPFEVDAGEVRKLKASGKNVSQIARELGTSRPSVYRALNAVVDEPRRMAKTRKPKQAA